MVNSNRKKPLPKKYEVTLFLIKGVQFLTTQFSVAFGEGQRPVNCPTRARSASDKATWIGLSGGREISRTSSSFFTNLGGSVFFFYGKEANNELNASSTVGGDRGGGTWEETNASIAVRGSPGSDARAHSYC